MKHHEILSRRIGPSVTTDELRGRHGKLAVRTTAVFILLAGIVTYPASAEDEIKSGNWEYSVTAPGITQLSPGMQPSPEIRLGPQGLTVIRTRCITAANPFHANAGRRTLQDGQAPHKRRDAELVRDLYHAQNYGASGVDRALPRRDNGRPSHFPKHHSRPHASRKHDAAKGSLPRPVRC